MYSQETVFVEKTISTLFPGGGSSKRKKYFSYIVTLTRGEIVST